MVNVLFIVYYFPPIGGAGVQRTLKFTRYLFETGYMPVILTGPGKSEDRWAPGDNFLLDEIPYDIPVYRIPAPLTEGENRTSHRIKIWLGLPVPFSQWWITNAVKLGEMAIAERKIDLIYASMSPFESADVANVLSKQFNIKWVADLRDPWALDEMQIYPSALHRNFELRKMHNLLSSASTIIMNTPEAVRTLRHAFPDFSHKEVVSITNGFDPADFEQIVPERNKMKFRIVHSGYFHADTGLNIMAKKYIYKILGRIQDGVDILTRSHAIFIKAVERWLESSPESAEKLEIIFIGAVTETDKELARRSSISKLIHFTGYLPHLKSLEYIRMSDLLFLPMHNLPPGKRATIVPGKTYEYMASGRAILAAVPDGDAKDFLVESGTAFICRPDDTEGMINILAKIYCAWEKDEEITSWNKDFITKFERRRLTEKLAGVFETCLKPNPDKRDK